MLVGEIFWDNLWFLKANLRGFELVSGLRVNFAKRNLFGINPPENFLVIASHFLSCSIDSLPFKCHGIPVGDNPRKVSTWIEVITLEGSDAIYWRKGELN